MQIKAFSSVFILGIKFYGLCFTEMDLLDVLGTKEEAFV